MQVDGERGQWEVHPSTKFHRVGGLASSGWVGDKGNQGSGSGGGDKFKWEEPFGANVEFTLGFSAEMVIGALGFYALGANVEITINPIGQIIGSSLMTSPLAAAGTLFGGDVAINFCSQSEVLYGPFLEVHRGVAITIGGELSLKPGIFTAAFELLTAGALHALSSILPRTRTASRKAWPWGCRPGYPP